MCDCLAWLGVLLIVVLVGGLRSAPFSRRQRQRPEGENPFGRPQGSGNTTDPPAP